MPVSPDLLTSRRRVARIEVMPWGTSLAPSLPKPGTSPQEREAGGTPVETDLIATADTSGWTMIGPNRKSIPVRVVAVAGDSIVTEAGPFESFIRKGAQVTTRTVNRLQDGKLVGTIEARYATKAGDSVAVRRSEGTRAP